MAVTAFRQNLLKLTKNARINMDRIILTNKGSAECVVLGIGDYKALKYAARLAHEPDVLKETYENLAAIQRGEGISLDEAFDRLEDRLAERRSKDGPEKKAPQDGAKGT
jgi:PHD/YefM family antitoxin component YafN of YafNO toxin-antitoxin module